MESSREKFKKETGEDAFFFSHIGQKLFSTKYISWLEEKATCGNGTELAEQQILGFHAAKSGETWRSLIKSMGLTMDEYNQLEDEGMINYLSDGEKEEITEAVFD